MQIIDFDKAKNEFIRYTENYDLTNIHIERKQQHSIRVMQICEEIAKRENFTEEEIQIAKIIGLLHDISRFKQYTEYQTFRDKASFDHGDMGVEILETDNFIRKFISNTDYDEVIKKAIKNHNKFEIEEGLTEIEEKFSKIIRDADKIDIFWEALELFWKNEVQEMENSKISKVIQEEFYKKRTIDRRKFISVDYIDKIIGIIAFVFDINYKISFEIIRDNQYIDKIINKFNFKNEETKEAIDNIKQFANIYISEKINEG